MFVQRSEFNSGYRALYNIIIIIIIIIIIPYIFPLLLLLLKSLPTYNRVASLYSFVENPGWL